MRLLFLTPFIPQPERHDALHHLAYLAARHTVTLVALYRDLRELDALPGLPSTLHRVCTLPISRRDSLRSCAMHAPTTWPLYLAYFYTRAAQQAIRQITTEEHSEVVHAHTLRMAPYTAALEDVWRVCNAQDLLTTRYRRYLRPPHVSWPLDLEEWLKLRHAEPALLRRMQRTAFVSEDEVREALALAPDLATPTILRPGLDPVAFAPIAGLADRDPATLVFLGRFSYRPNREAAIWIAREIFPLIQRAVPEARLTLVGSDPPAALRALASDVIQVTGAVADVTPFLGRATVALVPMTMPGGVKNKVLQPLAMETPVVTNDHGLRGTGLTPDVEITVAEGAAALAAACVQLLKNPLLRRRFGVIGRQAVIARHAWAAIGRHLDAFHQPQ